MIGIWLYIPSGYLNSRQVLQAQGLFRYALSASLAFAQYSKCPAELVVPWGFRKKIERLLRASGPQVVDRISVVSPASISVFALVAFTLSRLSFFMSKIQRLSARLTLIARTHALAILLAFAAFLGTLLLNPSLTFTDVRSFLFSSASILLLIITFYFFFLALSVAFSFLSRQELAQSLYAELEHRDSLALARFSNRRKKIKYWWVPSAMYGASSRLLRPTFVTFPDFAPLEDPSGAMLRNFPVHRFNQIREATAKATRVICLSNYVKDVHLKSILPKTHANAFTARPGPPIFFVDGSSYSRDLPAKRIPSELATMLGREATITVTVPTQNRPYKGIDTLIKSIASYRDYLKFNLRLHLTCSESDLGLGDLVRDLGLQDLVVFTPNLSDDELKNLIRKSTVCLSTSKFEASLPFTFSESTSLGTPCLLNQMPVTMENLERFSKGERPLLTFDIGNFRELEEKLIFISQNRSQVLEDQLRFHRNFYRKNSWASYVQAIETEWASLAAKFTRVE